MDPVTDLFAAMRIESVVYRRLELSAPWGLRIESRAQACFGTVVRGNCWLSVEGDAKPLALAAGDCFCFFAQGRTHTLRDHPRSRAHDMEAVIQAGSGDAVHFGGAGARTTLVGGKFTFDRTNSTPLAELLPPLIHLKADQAQATPLQQTLQLLASEAAHPDFGSPLVLRRLADILLIQAIRVHIVSGGCGETGWLRALADRQIGAALESMHKSIGQGWTVAALATAAGMSRSAFAARFKELLGEAPLEYLTRWRIYQAAMLLRESDKPLVDIARSIGYDAGGAFHKAFKRIMGATPGDYRRNGGALPSLGCGGVTAS